MSVSVVFSCVQTLVWLPASGIFSMCTDVDECDRTRGRGCIVWTPEQSLHWMLTLGEKSLPHRGLEPASVLRLVFQSDALPTELPLPQDKTAKGVFSQCQLWVQNVLQRSRTPCVQSHTICALCETSQTLGSHTIVWTHQKTQHTLRQPLKDGARLPELQGNWKQWRAQFFSWKASVLPE